MKGTKGGKKREYDFALIADGVNELSSSVEDALFEAGCDDATVGMRHGRLYIEFSRAATSFKQAILSAIRDVRKAGVRAEVLRVDACPLVSASQVARRAGRSRQQIYQYINGQRGPGGFPPPEYHLSGQAPLWSWSAVSQWLANNNLIRAEEGLNARVVAAINNRLDADRQREQSPELVAEIARALAAG